jgi:hypothetical protein
MSESVILSCGYPCVAPPGVRSWYPSFDPEPSPDAIPPISSVTFPDADPLEFRWIHTVSGWFLHGSRVPHEPVPIIAWRDVGFCVKGHPHPVVSTATGHQVRRGPTTSRKG